MRADNKHFTKVEILSFKARCKLDGMSYEQTVEVRTNDGQVIRLFDFMGFTVNESRLGKGKRVVLCVPYIEGEIERLDSGTPQILENDFDWETDQPSRLTLIARVIEASEQDHDLLVDAGFGKLYVIPEGDLPGFRPGDIIKFTAKRVDLIEILE